MPHGARDDANVEIDVDQYRLDDMAELAARLGSIVTIQRSGKVVFLDDFESGLGGWTTSFRAAGGQVVISNNATYQGGCSSRLDSGIGAIPTTTMTKWIPAFEWSSAGIACMWLVDNDLLSLTWVIKRYSGTRLTTWKVLYTRAAGTLSYFNAAGAPVVFATPGILAAGYKSFHAFKFVCDMTGVNYGRFYLDGVHYDLSAYLAADVASADLPYMQFSIELRGDTVNNTGATLDNVVLTFDEF